VGPKPKKLVSAKELVNLYIDICDQILVDNNLNQNNKYLFFSSLEQSIDQLAINLHTELNSNISNFHDLNFYAKWKLLSNEAALVNIIKREMSDDGFLSDILLAKDKLLIPIDTSIIASNDSINLKKLNSILDKYKSFILLLRKTLEEC
jgi:hypothetical protein